MERRERADNNEVYLQGLELRSFNLLSETKKNLTLKMIINLQMELLLIIQLIKDCSKTYLKTHQNQDGFNFQSPVKYIHHKYTFIYPLI